MFDLFRMCFNLYMQFRGLLIYKSLINNRNNSLIILTHLNTVSLRNKISNRLTLIHRGQSSKISVKNTSQAKIVAIQIHKRQIETETYQFQRYTLMISIPFSTLKKMQPKNSNHIQTKKIIILLSPTPPKALITKALRMKNKQQQNPQLQINIIENPSVVTNSTSSKQLKQSYSQYISKFANQIDYSKCSGQQLQASLSQMRIVLRELNLMLNKMMDKNYEYLAERDLTVNTPEKEIELLKAQVDNAKKLVAIQDSQITNLNNTVYEMEGKHSYEQELIDQIGEIKQRMPSVYLQSKHNACDINRNGYVLVNQEQDTSQYFRVNVLRSDIERVNERLKKYEEKYNSILEKQRELEQKNYQITQRFDKSLELAKGNSMEITAHGSIISFRQKYQILQKRKQQELKKIALQQHVARNNEAGVQKKISDMKKLMVEYNLKQEELHNRLILLQKESADLLKKSNMLNKLAHKSFSYRYAEVLLKGDKVQKQKKHNDKNKSYDDYEDDFEELEQIKSSVKKHDKFNNKPKQQNNVPLKPALNLIRKKNQLGQNKYQKSMSMVQIPTKNKNQKNPIFNFEDDEKQVQNVNKNPTFHIRRSSANEGLKINDKKQVNMSLDKTPESPNVKLWKNDKPEGKSGDVEQKQYKMSRPLMNLKKKNQNVSMLEVNQKDRNSRKNIKSDAEDIIVKPQFSRLTNKKTGNKMNDEYMEYLEEKGRKILGLT